MLRGSLTVWPPQSDCERHSTLAHQKLYRQAECTTVITSPLRDDQGHVIGAWAILLPHDLSLRPDTLQFVRACQVSFSSCLQLWKRADRSLLSRLIRSKREYRKSWRVRAGLGAVGLLVALLAMPMQYKISCDCRIQPVARRLVAAPFDATLDKALVAPGDLVAAGQVLARMDGREIRWELAGLTADRNRAGKQADAALALHNVAAAQQARLEMERLELKIRLLQDRTEHLEIKSPLSGIVVSGDLRKTEGAPLSIGQTLFEVAPLEQMVAELGVPEEDIAHIVAEAETTVWLDAHPQQRWTGTIVRIHPRSEIRDGRNVFVAEVALSNPDGLLRPGMNGSAKIFGPRRAGLEPLS